MAEERIFYCFKENEERTFTRVDKGYAAIGQYQCNGCGNVSNEASLVHPDGTGGDLVALLGEKIEKGEIKV